MSYETQLMGKPKKLASVKETYQCAACGRVAIRHRSPGLKTYVKWCCGEKMVLRNNKCNICKRRIRGADHFQGQHHLAAKSKLGEV